MCKLCMTRWKKDEVEFTMSLNDDHNGSHYVRVPKPIVKVLGNPQSIVFKIVKDKIIIMAPKEDE